MKAVLQTSDFRERAKMGIDRADDTTVKMILAMLEVQEQESASLNSLEEELEQRFKDYEEGKIIPLTLDELESRARKSHQERLKKVK